MSSAGPTTPAGADAMFGPRLELATAYVERLAGDGITRGLIGPREGERLWDRHLLNSAAMTELLPADARVVDVGTGAGLPGIPMAIRRPDLRVDLVEPMLRRTTFLDEVVGELALEHVRVLRGRADDREIVERAGSSDWVVARAVGPLDRLARWCLPLLAPGGRLLAMKGQTAERELDENRVALARLGVRDVAVERVSVPGWDDSILVVSMTRGRAAPAGRARPKATRGRASQRGGVA